VVSQFSVTISTSDLVRDGCRWPIFARKLNACITFRSRKQSGAECYGTSTSDKKSGSTGGEYSTSQVTGSTFLPIAPCSVG